MANMRAFSVLFVYVFLSKIPMSVQKKQTPSIPTKTGNATTTENGTSTMIPTVLTTTTKATTIATTTPKTTTPSNHEMLMIDLSALSALSFMNREPEVVEKTKDTCRSSDICATMRGMCNNGKCIPMPCSEFECVCEPGYVGQFCDTQEAKTPKPASTTTAPSTTAKSPPAGSKTKTHVNGNVKNMPKVTGDNMTKAQSTSTPTATVKNETSKMPKHGPALEGKDLVKNVSANANTATDNDTDIAAVDVNNVTKSAVDGNTSKLSKGDRVPGKNKGATLSANHDIVDVPNNAGNKTGLSVEQTNALNSKKSEGVSSTTELPKGSFRKGNEAVVLVDKTAIYVRNTSEVLKNGTATVVTKTKAVVPIEIESSQSRIFGIPTKNTSPVIASDNPKKHKQKKHKTKLTKPTATTKAKQSELTKSAKSVGEKNGVTSRKNDTVSGSIKSKTKGKKSKNRSDMNQTGGASKQKQHMPSILTPFFELMNISHAYSERINGKNDIPAPVADPKPRKRPK